MGHLRPRLRSGRRRHDDGTGLPGIESHCLGQDLAACKDTLDWAFDIIRTERRLLAACHSAPARPLHQRRPQGWYRDDLDEHAERDPTSAMPSGAGGAVRRAGVQDAVRQVQHAFDEARQAEEPDPALLLQHAFAPTPIMEEIGGAGEKIPFFRSWWTRPPCHDGGLAVDPLMLLYGQDVGEGSAGVPGGGHPYQKFGDDRVFNTPIRKPSRAARSA